MENRHTFLVIGEDSMRADIYLSQSSDLGSRSQIKNRTRELLINGQPAKLSQIVEVGDKIEICFENPQQFNLEPEQMQAEILFENTDVLVVNKPSGMVVHPAKGNYSGTLLHGLLGHISNLQQEFSSSGNDHRVDTFRPGIVHRLDKDTSGVMIVAKHPEALAFLVKEFAERRVGKLYCAIVKGIPKKTKDSIQSKIIRDPANRKRFTAIEKSSIGKESHTIFRQTHSFQDGNRKFSMLCMYPCTGRTHQLRVHMKYIGCPIYGDPLYSRCNQDEAEMGLMLHATLLSIRLPGTDHEQIFFAAVPDRFKHFETQDHTIPADMDWYVSQLQLLREDPALGKS